jgi:hypothetical protein
VRRGRSTWPVILVVVAAFALSTCASGGQAAWVQLTPESVGSGPTLRITGTVQHLDLEGGIFVLRTTDGTRYSPTNLPEAFRVDGLRVEADARRREHMVSIGMAGELVELLRIRKASGTP